MPILNDNQAIQVLTWNEMTINMIKDINLRNGRTRDNIPLNNKIKGNGLHISLPYTMMETRHLSVIVNLNIGPQWWDNASWKDERVR